MNKDRGRKFLKSLLIVIAASLFFSCGGNLFANADDEEKPKVKQTHLMIMNADGTGLKVLFQSEKFTGLGSPAFSSDGKQIAMDGWQSHLGETFNQGHILVINSDGTDLKDAGDGLMPSWSSDGKQLTFSRNGVWTMDVDGENREQIDPRGWGAQWSPDGVMIIYSESSLGGVNLKIYNTQEETFRYVFPFEESPYQRYYWNSCWSPDSKSICIKGRTKEGAYEIATVEIDKGLKGLKVHYSHPKRQPGEDYSWHLDGKRILCTLQVPEFKVRKIFTFNPSTKEAMKVMPGQTFSEIPGSVCWSPDGKKLIFTLIVIP